ncbi:PH domain-containing protein [Bacillus aquiflavi]|uniref:PH domain-containing protein n=1 Tax=Bacillus aquiflavi TaxID=2672567 RepID=UPI001CA9842E|nr:PH domain-containing protein [Bacillus aquiflavi]UAC48484.1 PH domain-containing protein [Bacillus aquiflavi]
MSEAKRLHPITILIHILKQLKEFIIPIIIFIFLGSRDGDKSGFFFLIGISIAIAFVLVSAILSWVRFTYRIEEGELRIEHGIFVKKKRYIPFERIQSIDLSEGILQRPFGLVKLSVETAGSGGANLDESEANLTAITKKEANTIQAIIAAEKNKMNIDETSHVNEQKEHEEILYEISSKELLLLASTSGGVGVVISAFFAFIFQFEEYIPYERIFKDFEQIAANGFIFISILVFIGFLIAWVVALIGTMIKYASYTVKKVNDDLIISRGLVEKRQLTIPIKRIQAIRIAESPIRQPFGLCSVFVESAGGSVMDKEGASVMLLPLIKKDKISTYLAAGLNVYNFNPTFKSVPKRALKRYIFRGLLYVLPLVAAALFFFRQWGLFSLILPLISIYWSYLRYKDAGWSLHNQQLNLRSRFMIKNTFFMIKNRVQSLDIQHSFFQRRKKLATVVAMVKSGEGHASGKVIDIESSDADVIYQWFSKRSLEKNR